MVLAVLNWKQVMTSFRGLYICEVVIYSHVQMYVYACVVLLLHVHMYMHAVFWSHPPS